jgi:XTP/dITP diphosphohydrolase
VTRLVLATRNKYKIVELEPILAAAGVDAELVGVDAFDHLPDVPETGRTFVDNALLKARAVAAATGLPALADDSGLCVDALNGMPGVLSARWAGRHGDDGANLRLLLGQLADVPAADRGAHFACAAALALPTIERADATERVAEGRVDGSLVWEPRGTNGFGYDPIFVPTGDTRTLAEYPPDEKNTISHRARAFGALAPLVRELVG